jgi:RNA polymerase sigma-70 factor (ECF subfamily)
MTDGTSASAAPETEAAVEEAFRTEWGRLVSTLIRVTGNWDVAEECVQDAFAQAVVRWPVDGVPRRPGAWLTTVARNRALDRRRRGLSESARLRALAVIATDGETIGDPVDDPATDDIADDDAVADDRLRLIFTCCHPALPLDARVALTLRTLAGLSTAQIARAFLVPETAMAQRLVRAKRKIRNAGIPYRVPPAHLLPERTSAVLSVLYLLFNEGYSAGSGPDPSRPALTGEAIRLARVLVELMPGEPEAGGLLALLLLHDSRRSSRVDAAGDVVTLENQDRTAWDQAEIGEGLKLLDAALADGRPGYYQVQAAIAACHATATEAADTDWPQIALLYAVMSRLNPSPVVELNRAVAVAMANGPAAGLELVEALINGGELAGYYLLPATQADLLRRLERGDEAAEAYRQALALAPTDVERRYFARRLTEL